jgi:cobalt-zinc-cadmium efflux system outer membrane protein
MKQSIVLTLVLLFGGLPSIGSAQTSSSSSSPAVADHRSAQPATGGATLDVLIGELERVNPELQAARREIDMRAARIAPAGALPDPTFSVGFMNQFAAVPFFPPGDSPQAFRQFSFSQELPFPGKRALRTQVASTDVDAVRWSYEATRRRLVSDLKSAYFEYAYTVRTIDVVERNKTLLEQMRQIAEARFSVGKATQQDVLKAQVEVSLLLERLAILEQQRASVQAEVNGLLYRKPDTPLGSVGAYALVGPLQSLDTLRALAEKNSAALKGNETGINRGQQSLALAGRELRPDFGVTVTSQKFTQGMPWMYGVDFMVRIPLYWQRKQRPMIAEAAASLESARQMRNNTFATEQAQVTQEYLAATTSQRLADLYGDTILPQARLTLESSLASYQVGTVDFLTLLSSYQTVLTYEVSYEEQAAKYRQALARLEAFIGQELVR